MRNASRSQALAQVFVAPWAKLLSLGDSLSASCAFAKMPSRTVPSLVAVPIGRILDKCMFNPSGDFDMQSPTETLQKMCRGPLTEEK